MKQFFLKSLLLIVPVLGILLVAEQQLGKVKNSYNAKIRELKKNAKEFNTIILGSSQAYYGINPAFFEKKAFNLANSSQSLNYDSDVLLKSIDDLPSLKNVIITVSYFSFYYDLDFEAESWRSNYYTKFYGVNHTKKNFLEIRKYSLLALYTPKEALSFFSKGLSGIDLSEGVDKNGFLIRDSVGLHNRISDSSGKNRFLFHSSIMKEQYHAKIIQALNDLLLELKKRKVSVYFVSTPLYKTYSTHLNKQVQQKNDSLISQLCKKYSCSYLDFSSDKRFVKEDFYDNDHLNVYGANKLSTIINDVIQ
jgi:hypothetical protein